PHCASLVMHTGSGGPQTSYLGHRRTRRMTMKPISTVRSGIAALALVAGAIPAAGAFPERAITLIVPFAAGGPGDTVVRLIGAHMARTLGQPIVVENAAGAGGTSAITRATQAGADGYTIMLGNMGTHGAAPAQY